MDKKLQKSAKDFMPVIQTLSSIKKASKQCQGCHLYKHATQTVFGEGSSNAPLMVVGEIAGNKEDEIGIPFIGPAGTFLRSSMEDVGLNLKNVYFTNVVKHFKFIKYHNKRLHRTPITSEIKACSPWLEAEIKLIQPKIILCLGAIAAKTIITKQFQLRAERGKWFQHLLGIALMATFHPSAILRAPDKTSRHEMKRKFIQDIKKINHFLNKQH